MNFDFHKSTWQFKCRTTFPTSKVIARSPPIRASMTPMSGGQARWQPHPPTSPQVSFASCGSRSWQLPRRSSSKRPSALRLYKVASAPAASLKVRFCAPKASLTDSVPHERLSYSSKAWTWRRSAVYGSTRAWKLHDINKLLGREVSVRARDSRDEHHKALEI